MLAKVLNLEFNKHNRKICRDEQYKQNLFLEGIDKLSGIFLVSIFAILTKTERDFFFTFIHKEGQNINMLLLTIEKSP